MNQNIVKLGMMGSFIRGSGIPKSDIVPENGLPCVRYAEIYTRYGEVIRNPVSMVSEEGAKSALRLETGDIIFPTSGETAKEIGKATAFVGEQEAYVGGDTIVLRGHGQNAIFLAHALNSWESNHQKCRLATGNSVVHIYSKELAQIELWRPTITVQNKIVEILSESDAGITLLDKKLSCLRLSMAARIEDLIWQENHPRTELLDNCTLVSEKVLPAIMPAQVKCIELEHIDADAAGTINGFSNSEDLSSQKTKFAKGDVLFGKLRPYLRKFAYAEFDGICSTEIWALRAHSERMLSRFLFYVLGSKRIYAEANKSFGTKMPRADWSLLSLLPIPTPNLQLQEKLVQALDCFQDEINQTTELKNLLKHQKRGVMQQLLTGKLRVKGAS